MKQLKFVVYLILTIFLSGCSFGYDILIVNSSDKPIEVRYKITERGHFDEPMTKSVADWSGEKSIKRFWTKETPWQTLPEDRFKTVLGERIIRVLPKQVVRIEDGNYNPISEEYGDLTEIIELTIISPNGQITYKGKLLLNQFEKDGYTFIKTYQDELNQRDSQ